MALRSRGPALAGAWAVWMAWAATAAAQAPTSTPPPPPPSPTAGAPATDIFLLDLRVQSGVLHLGRPQPITHHPGYDNQPAFSTDGRALYYTSESGGQTDIQRYDLATHETRPWALTKESEFSPTPAPPWRRACPARRCWRRA